MHIRRCTTAGRPAAGRGFNPVDRIQWTAPAVAASVDGGSSSAPPRLEMLLTAVGRLGRRGEHLETFFATLYYAALRPSEAVKLREADLHLPRSGWGRIVLAASASRAGRAWTDAGTARQERGLKHRAVNETRTIPIPWSRSGCSAPTSPRPSAPHDTDDDPGDEDDGDMEQAS